MCQTISKPCTARVKNIIKVLGCDEDIHPPIQMLFKKTRCLAPSKSCYGFRFTRKAMVTIAIKAYYYDYYYGCQILLNIIVTNIAINYYYY